MLNITRRRGEVARFRMQALQLMGFSEREPELLRFAFGPCKSEDQVRTDASCTHRGWWVAAVPIEEVVCAAESTPCGQQKSVSIALRIPRGQWLSVSSRDWTLGQCELD